MAINAKLDSFLADELRALLSLRDPINKYVKQFPRHLCLSAPASSSWQLRLRGREERKQGWCVGQSKGPPEALPPACWVTQSKSLHISGWMVPHLEGAAL